MEQTIFVEILASLQKLFVGYILAVIFGILIALLISVSNSVFQIFKWIFIVPRSVAPIAFFPIALLVFKQTDAAAIVVVFISALWSIIIDTAAGIQQFRKQGNNFRVAIAHTFKALKTGAWVAWFTVIATEMLVGGKGLGSVIWSAYKAKNFNYIVELIIYIGVIGFLLDQILDITGSFLAEIVSEGKKE